MLATAIESAQDVDLLTSLERTVPRETWSRALKVLGGLRGLVLASDTMLRLYGVPPGAADVIRAALEFTRRVRQDADERPLLSTPKQIDRFLRPELGHLAVERFVVLCVDANHRLLHHEVVAHGTQDQCLVEPRAVFAPALVAHAPAIIVAHNHPSGSTRPSSRDLVLTAHLVRAADALNIALVDHLVIGHPGYSSLRERGVPMSEGQPLTIADCGGRQS